MKTVPVPGWYVLYTVLPLFAHELSLRGYTWGGGQAFRFWSGLVGPTGSGKSTAAQLTQDFAKAWWELRTRDAGVVPDPYVSISSTSVEATIHAIGERTKDGLTCAILTADEFTSVIQRKGFLEFLNTIYDGRDYTMNYMKYRGTDVKGLIQAPRVSLVALTTIDALGVNAERDFGGGGMLNRINWVRELAMPYDDEDRTRDYREQALLWQAWSRKLIVDEAMGFKHGGATYAWPKDIQLEVATKPIVKALAMNNGELSMADNHVGVHYRAAGVAKMIACMFALADGRAYATVEDAQIACRLCERAVGAAIRTDREIDKRNPDYAMQERILEAIRAGGEGGVSQRDLSRMLHLAADQLKRHIDGLRNMDLIRVEIVGGSKMVVDATHPMLATKLN